MRSRIKAASAAAVAVLAIAALLDSPRAGATQGQPVIAGSSNTELGGTAICLFKNGDACVTAGAIGAATDQSGVAVFGEADKSDAFGVKGMAFNGTGVYGDGIYAVHGHSDTGWGVWGEGSDRGVYGISDNEGVVGFSNNVGIRAESPNIALRVKGKAEFSRSGTVSISYPNKQATVTGVPVTAKSLAFATLQQFLAGRYVLAAVPNLGGSSNSFTIYLNKPPGSSSTPKSVVVAWQVIEKP
jgi:hypothetical protein